MTRTNLFCCHAAETHVLWMGILFLQVASRVPAAGVLSAFVFADITMQFMFCHLAC